MPTEQSALSPQSWPFELAFLPDSAYLVGGSVRDALLGRQAEYLDLDFVLPEKAIETARTIAHHYGAGFVVLDSEHQIARVVFDNATVDFAQQIGSSLEADLYRRDFTINAIAYHPHSESLLDPVNGHLDLQKRTLRMIAPQNLAEDPLRLLRAYRQAAQLGFSVDAETQVTIRTLVKLLSQVAAERVRGELDCLLSFAEGTALLQMAWQDGLLGTWLPYVTQEQLTALKNIDHAFVALQQSWPSYADLLTGWVREQSVPGLHRSWLKATKLSQLVSADPNTAEVEMSRLKYSRAEQQAVVAILKGWLYLQSTQVEALSRRQQYMLFKASGSSFLGIALLGLAQGLSEPAIGSLIQRYLDPHDPVAHPCPLLSGRDLMQHLNLRPGPQIGELLEAIQIVQAEGEITTQAEALQWAKEQLQHP
ncbi:CCA tRNA nucleotidyltransferase [Pseudanabaena sp. FACHB-2040]|uniref:CCA tRNA nucleotidyltransferase n=1 Tax=Pseudanabaena sp. FACHB-2040 TaxID=2692859 RepID=UPI0032206ECC